jgi:hypothetical protein
MCRQPQPPIPTRQTHPAGESATQQPGNGSTGEVPTTLRKAEAPADAALKAKEKGEQATSKAKSFFDALTKKKK